MQYHERRTARLEKSRLEQGVLLRDAVLPEYSGESDEHVLAGKVDGPEALKVFREHYAKLGQPIEVEAISAGEIMTAGGKRHVWLPVTFGWGQLVKQRLYEIQERDRMIVSLKADISGLESTIRDLILKNSNLQNQLDHIALVFAEADDEILGLRLDLKAALAKPWWKFWL